MISRVMYEIVGVCCASTKGFVINSANIITMAFGKIEEVTLTNILLMIP